MNREPMWCIAPSETTPEMEAAALAAKRDGEDFAGQYRAALAAYAKANAGRKSSRKASVSAERGEALLQDLENGINSITAAALFQHILAAEKRQALAIMRDESLTGQDAEDLYAYCRAKWLGNRLIVVEVPKTRIVGFVQEEDARAQQARETRPQYLMRQGLNIIPCVARLKEDSLTFFTSRDEVELKDVKQLWLIATQP